VKNRKAIGWTVFSLGMLSAGFCIYICVSALQTPADDEYKILKSLVILLSLGGVIIGILGVIGGLYLARLSLYTSRNAKLLGRAMFIVGIISLPVAALTTWFWVSSGGDWAVMLLVDLVYYASLPIAGWLLSHPENKESSAKF
jgi:hypothetical protein